MVYDRFASNCIAALLYITSGKFIFLNFLIWLLVLAMLLLLLNCC